MAKIAAAFCPQGLVVQAEPESGWEAFVADAKLGRIVYFKQKP